MNFHSNNSREHGHVCGQCCGSWLTDNLETFNEVNQGITMLLSPEKHQIHKEEHSIYHEMEVPGGWLYIKQLQEPIRNEGSLLNPMPLTSFHYQEWGRSYERRTWPGLEKYTKEIENSIISCHTNNLNYPGGKDIFKCKNSFFLFIQTPNYWDHYNLDEVASKQGLVNVYTGPRSYNSNYLYDDDELMGEDDYDLGGGKRLQLKVYYHE